MRSFYIAVIPVGLLLAVSAIPGFIALTIASFLSVKAKEAFEEMFPNRENK